MKISFQEVLLKNFTNLPFEAINDLVNSVYKYDQQVLIGTIIDPSVLEEEFSDATLEQLLVFAEREDSPLIHRIMTKKITLMTNSNAKPGEYTVNGNDTQVIKVATFDANKLLVFRQELELKDELYKPGDFYMEELSSTSYKYQEIL